MDARHQTSNQPEPGPRDDNTQHDATTRPERPKIMRDYSGIMEDDLEPSQPARAPRQSENSSEAQQKSHIPDVLRLNPQRVAGNSGPGDITDGPGDRFKLGVDQSIDPRLESKTSTGQTTRMESVLESDSSRHPQESKPLDDSGNASNPNKDEQWTQLHSAVNAGDFKEVQKLLKRGAHLEDADTNGRKPLLMAAEKGFVKIVKLLLRSASVESLNEVNHSTALTRACEASQAAVVKILVDHGANIEARDKDGRTPLLIAVSLRNHDVVRYLLKHGADKTATSTGGISADNLAQGDENLIRILQQDYLLEGPEIRAKRNVAESQTTYVRAPEKPSPYKLDACKSFQAEVVQFFIGNREQRSRPVRVSVYELIYGRGPDALFSPPPMSPPSGFPGSSRVPRPTRGNPTFTWYHIPANNKAWVNDLIIRLLSERRPQSAMPDTKFKSQMGLNSMEGRGTSRRSRPFSYMRPFAKSVKTDTNMCWGGGNTEQAVSFVRMNHSDTILSFSGLIQLQVPFLNYETFGCYQQTMQDIARLRGRNYQAPGSWSTHPWPIPRATRPPPPRAPTPPLRASVFKPPGGLANVNIRGGSGPPPPTQQPRPPASRGQYTRFLGLFSSGKPPRTSKKKFKMPMRFFDSIYAITNPYVRLMRGYGVAEFKDEHIEFQPRRTLDQYFYSDLENTLPRDRDQVVYRYTRKEAAKIFMVDQMWLWIVNGDTLITCAPEPWRFGRPYFPPDQNLAIDEEALVRGPSIERPRPPSVVNETLMTPAEGRSNLAPDTSENLHYNDHVEEIDENLQRPEVSVPRASTPQSPTRGPGTNLNTTEDLMDIQHRVLRHLKETFRDPIESIYDLAGLIATCCASAFDENQIPDDLQFFDFFERSIGSVVRQMIDRATKSLHEFKGGLLTRPARPPEPPHFREPSVSEEKASVGDEPTDEDLNIAIEIDLLVEIEDIQDELHILRLVLRDQKRALRQLDGVLVQGKKKYCIARKEGDVVSMVDTSCIDHHNGRITEMEKLAEKAQKSLYQLIDLKQKQANFFQAISTRKLARETAKNTQLQIQQSEEISRQAEETARQGKTLMVFTVVTIIFLPLSFMAAFFAINIDAFPVDQGGKIKLGYVLKYMLSTSLALAIPFVLLALRINDVKQVGHGAYRGLRKALVSPRLLPAMGYAIMGLLVVVVPSIVWTSKLSTTAKVAITVLLGVILLSIAIGLLMRWIISRAVEKRMAAWDSSSYISSSLGGPGS